MQIRAGGCNREITLGLKSQILMDIIIENLHRRPPNKRMVKAPGQHMAHTFPKTRSKKVTGTPR